MGPHDIDHQKEGEKLEQQERTVFICEEPLTIRHLYTEPYEQTITKGWGAWALVSQNKRKGTVKLHLIADAGNTVAELKKEVFEKHFKPF